MMPFGAKEETKHTIEIIKWAMIFRAIKISPVVISIPHDGMRSSDFKGFFTTRENGLKDADIFTWLLARDILLNYPASAIRGLMPRAFIDYNRPFSEAVDQYDSKLVSGIMKDDRLTNFYRFYHNSIKALLRRAIREFEKKNVLLIDIHGFKNQPHYAPDPGYDIILGTGNKKTIIHGKVDVNFAEFMRRRGYHVFLPKASRVGKEEDYFPAGYTTTHHSKSLGINCIQMEVSRRFRDKDNPLLGEKLSKNIAEFLKLYYPI